MKDTDPDLVFLKWMYWTVIGQNDPVEYMKKYPIVLNCCILKDRAILGQSGFMKTLEMIFKQAYQIGVKEYYVELEGMPDGRYPVCWGKGCADYLLKAKFVK